jgi:lipid-binding SYLF domain-containing protein
MPSWFRNTRENVAVIRFPRTRRFAAAIGSVPTVSASHVSASHVSASHGRATASPVRSGLIATGLMALALAGCARGSGGEQTLVDRAALTVQELMTQNVSQDPKIMLRRAKGVMICPQVFKAGFFVGGEGGSCVLLARSGNGTWSYPTFYDIGSGSFGFQFGMQDSQLMLLIMTTRGLNAVMDSQVRLGANLSVAVASVGAGVQGATTAAVGADILAFAEARGLFGGVSLDGGVMSARVDENQSYYGQPLAPRQIILQMQGVNPGADPLRELLTRYGGSDVGGGALPPPSYAPPSYSPSGQPAYPPSYQPQPSYQGPPPAYSPSYPPPPAYQPSSSQPAYQPPPAPAPYQPPAPRPYSPAYQPPAVAPAYVPPQGAPSGYQPPPGQYTYPPTSGAGPVQQQSLPPPPR